MNTYTTNGEDSGILVKVIINQNAKSKNPIRTPIIRRETSTRQSNSNENQSSPTRKDRYANRVKKFHTTKETLDMTMSSINSGISSSSSKFLNGTDI